MPYNSKGIATTEGSKRIEISNLFERGYIKKGCRVNSNLSWVNNWNQNTGIVGIESMFNENEKWIRLYYTITTQDGTKTNYDYKIYLIPVKSNLGIGDVYYFQCPVSYQKCRILYMAYSSHYFKCREAYQNRIYYNIQTVSKQFYYGQRYFDIEKQLDKIYYNKKYFKETYRGQETRAYKRIQKLQNKYSLYSDYRFNSLLNSLSRLKRLSK